MAEPVPRRLLIATATTTHPMRPDLEDRPELFGEVDRVTRLFTLPQYGFGYTTVAGFAPDMRGAKLKERIRDVVTSRALGPDDHVVFYYTGHGEVDESGEFIFPLTDTTDDLVGTGLRASELARLLMIGSNVQRLLVILDTCYAGSAGAELATRTIDALGRLRGLAKQPNFAILTATRPREQAMSGTFTQAFERAITHRASGGHEPRFLPLDAVADLINADPDKAPSQNAQLFSAGETEAAFLPNPRFNEWLRGLDLRTQLDHEQRRERDREFRDHVMPRAQGLDRAQEGVWLFTGRHAALRGLSDWLIQCGSDGRTRVVTGDPGSGKSALLARLTVLARPEHQRKVPRIDELPPDTLPPRNSIDVFIHARGQTSDQVLAALCSAAGVEPLRPGELLAELTERQRPFVAVIDALDEATDPGRLAERVLAPLLRGAPRTQLRLILGTRRHLLDKLGGPVQLLDLDAERYADPRSVQAYARRCLVDLVPNSPYRTRTPEVLDAVASAVGSAAGRSFLVALITGRSLALRADVPNPYDARWREGLPRIAADAMRLDLDQRLGDQATKARDLLMPLAYALGSGLPWEDVWAPLASTLAERDYTMSDLEWLIREAGFYVVETLEGNRSVYRLYHEALAEHLREARGDCETHKSIVGFWTARTPLTDGRPDWSRAHSYARRHLATHATAAGMFDLLILDPAYLLHADRPSLLAALPAVRDSEADAAAHTYRRTIKHLRDKNPAEQWAYLELAAHCYNARELARRISAEIQPLPWRTAWAQWVRQSRDAVIRGHEGRVTSIVTGEVYDHSVIVSGSEDGSIRAWDLATGIPVIAPIRTAQGGIQAIALCTLEGRPIVASGGTDTTIRVWDYETGMAIGEPMRGHGHHIRAMAASEIDGRPVLVTGSYDDTVRVWDLATGKSVGEPLRTHGGNITAVAIAGTTWRPLVISGSSNGSVQAWDLVNGNQVTKSQNDSQHSMLAMDVAESVDGVTIVTSDSDEAVRAVDLMTGASAGAPAFVRHNPAWAIAARYLNEHLVLVSGHNDRSVRSWDLTTGAVLKPPFRGHESSIHAITIGHLDGQPLAVSGGDDGTVQVHDLGEQGEDVTSLGAHLRGIRCVAAGTARNRRIVISGSDDRVIRLWNATTGDPVGKPLSGHTSSVRALAVGNTAGPQILISGSRDGSVRVWDLDSGEPIRKVPFNHGSPVCAVGYVVVKGQRAAVSGGEDGSVMVWGLETGARLTSTLEGFLYPVVVTAVGRATGRVEAVDSSADGGQESHVWGPLRGSLVAKQSQLGSTAVQVVSLFVEVKGKYVIASGDQEGVFRIWSVGDGRRGKLLKRRDINLRLVNEETGPGPVTAIAHHPKRGFAIAYKHLVRIADSNGLVRTIHADSEVRTMVFVQENTLVVGTTQGIVTLLV